MDRSEGNANRPDASTQLYGVLGNPVRHSLSPLIHNAAFRKTGLNASYMAFQVEEGTLPLAFEAIRALGLRGVNVTIPFKEEAESLVDEIPEDLDRAIGAINTVVNRDGILYGHNTDVRGFLTAAAEELGFHPSGKTVLVLGAGGAARAVAFAVASAGAARVLILNRTRERGEGLMDYAAGFFPETEFDSPYTPLAAAAEKPHLIVNATSLGLRETDEPSFDANLLTPATSVFDLIYNPAETPLLREAKKRGLKAANGLGMLAAQAAAAFELWTGVKDGVRETMLEELRAWGS